MTTVAIIGTAGRREDGARLNWDVYCKMRLAVIKELLKIPRPWKGRSGGAAWADHLAVVLFLSAILEDLELFFPCSVNQWGEFDNSEAGKVARHYHNAFSRERGKAQVPPSFDDLAAAMHRGARTWHVEEGFHARNLLVGQCDVLIALTFGGGQIPKDGGTRHCWDNSPAPLKIHIPIADLISPPAQQNLFSEGP